MQSIIFIGIIATLTILAMTIASFESIPTSAQNMTGNNVTKNGGNMTSGSGAGAGNGGGNTTRTNETNQTGSISDVNRLG